MVALPKLIIWGAFHITLNSFSVSYLSYDGWSVFQPLFLWVKTQLVVIKRSILQFCHRTKVLGSLAPLSMLVLVPVKCLVLQGGRKTKPQLGNWSFCFLFSFFFFFFFRFFVCQLGCVHLKLRLFRLPISASPDYRTSQSQRNTSCKAQEIVRSRFAFVLCPKFEANHKKPKI